MVAVPVRTVVAPHYPSRARRPPLPPLGGTAGGGSDGGDSPPRRNPRRGARRADFVDEDDDEEDATDDHSGYLPLPDYSSAGLPEVGPVAREAPLLPRATPSTYWTPSGERQALRRRTPIWGFVLPHTRPDEFGDRYPRPFWVHNDSRWTDDFASAPAPVIEDARTIYNACAWTQQLHNLLLEAEVDLLRGEHSASELLREAIYTSAAVHQLFLILVTRCTFLSERSSNPTLAANR